MMVVEHLWHKYPPSGSAEICSGQSLGVEEGSGAQDQRFIDAFKLVCVEGGIAADSGRGFIGTNKVRSETFLEGPAGVWVPGTIGALLPHCPGVED